MNVFQIAEIGKFIRKMRKEKGLRLEDLSDDQISTATISNIERGVPHVNQEKVLYLMKKLNLDMDKLPEILVKENEDMESMFLKFHAIENMLHLEQLDQAWESLKELSEESTFQYQATLRSLKGRYYLQCKKWRRAERELTESNLLIQQDPYAKKVNLEAINYYSLACCSYKQNHLQQALKYIERGLEVVGKNGGEDDQIKYKLMMNRVVYLEKLGRIEEALNHAETLWEEISEVRDITVLIQIHALKAELLRKIKLYHDAIRYAKEGINLAVSARDYNNLTYLWTTLGTLYLELGNKEDAETCFKLVLSFQDQIQDKNKLLLANNILGSIFLLQDRLDEAEKAFVQAIEWGEKIKGVKELVHSIFLLGKVKRQKGEYKQAISHYHRASELAKRMEAYPAIFRCYFEIALCYRQLGDQENMKKYFDLMNEVQKEIDAKDGLFQLL
ncbi:helix-turn-helix domain-containing protein [Thermoflavimicrobium dichotomicum]|uniref:Tetratricopeptide repeat-containing protein n=1 Tax=Thermoflavimicrobium dichotomicum TaxID=46223 RepID=A0A1I3JL45_9BACL|nr:helix-turn-helix domain-containing protein [Thermoflavimicrobium dichotomicum]SFI60981.1 Tetratricopeptide repeat-containing protein [Thermoflavimicrobium dichotomicum]